MSFLRSHAAAQTFVIYCHLVSIGCPSRTSAWRIMCWRCPTVENVVKGLFDLTFRNT